jgi:hypothetical protein
MICLLLALMAPSVAGLGVAWFLKSQPYASNVTLALTVSRFAFELEKPSLGDEFIRSLNVRSMAMTNVNTVEFAAHRLSVADQNRYDLRTNSYPEQAWKHIVMNRRRIVFQGEPAPALPFVQIRPKHQNEMLQLDPVRVKVPSQITLEVAGEDDKWPDVSSSTKAEIGSPNLVELRARIDPQEGVFTLVTDESVQIEAHELSMVGNPLVASNLPATFSVEFDRENTKITIIPGHGPVDLCFHALLGPSSKHVAGPASSAVAP